MISTPAIGRRRWAIDEGYIPSGSTGPEPAMTSHETACILNASDRELSDPESVPRDTEFRERDHGRPAGGGAAHAPRLAAVGAGAPEHRRVCRELRSAPGVGRDYSF